MRRRAPAREPGTHTTDEPRAGSVVGTRVAARVLVRVLDPALCPFLGEPEVGFTLRSGRTVWLAGPSGAGKTSVTRTLLAAAAGATASSGWRSASESAALGFRCELSGPVGRVAFVSQDAPLIDSLTVESNLVLACQSRPGGGGGGGSSSDTPFASLAERCARLLQQAELDYSPNLLRKFPSELSLGMRRRVSLAMSLGTEPDTLVLDEPFSSLDSAAARSIARTLIKLQLERGLAVLLINHVAELGELMRPDETVELVHVARDERAAALVPAPPPLILNLLQQLLSQGAAGGGGGTGGGGSSLAARTGAELRALLLLGLPLCGMGGALVGGGFLTLANSILKYADTAALLQVMPAGMRSSPLFALARAKIETVGADLLQTLKPRVIGAGLAYVTLVELAPLVVGMLMAGVLGATHGGRIATMQATEEDALLRSMGYRPWRWTLVPALLSAALGAPLLVAACAAGVLAAGVAALDETRAGNKTLLWGALTQTATQHNLNGGQYWQRGLLSYPPFISVYRAAGFLAVALLASELATRKIVPANSARRVSHAVAASVTSAFVAALLLELVFANLLLYTMHLPDVDQLNSLSIDLKQLIKGET
jgi:ABC-type nitrate/sulfonate/bicarbonate transport system ATPase subunit/ABC-type transporter Mla maintaining outer membrane lipid asymmetry permease subunit MlaE